MDDGTLCTLDELTGLVERALSVDYPGAPTGRVRDVPDQRAIRWYITRGLVDRPAATRGRVALYGRRHLLQLVAIKRRQADGASLADIQAELAGATDDTLARVARLGPMPEPAPQPAPLPRRDRFWVDRPAAVAASASTAADRPAPVVAPADTAADRPATERASTTAERAAETVALHGIRLAPGITLLIEDGVAPAPDPAAIKAAARPLLNLLAAGGHAPHASDEE